ncbi:LOW QUALITY PROTEIN: hypothetical protein ACHAWX_005209 [Stephanocyclus meneghinianus]
MGVEIALLSRNIKIEVFHTPGTAQTIEGVEFTNIGQQQEKNRFLLHFLYSGDVPGTSIARNLIRNSNYCCVVFEGSYNMTKPTLRTIQQVIATILHQMQEAVTKCPNVEADSIALSPGPIMMDRSDLLSILTKAIEGVNGSLSYIAPVARS